LTARVSSPARPRLQLTAVFDPGPALHAQLGHAFRDAELLARALTHRSWANEHPPAGDNESLAFLGDAVLALVVAEHLWRAEPDAPAGRPTPGPARVGSGAGLAPPARRARPRAPPPGPA